MSRFAVRLFGLLLGSAVVLSGPPLIQAQNLLVHLGFEGDTTDASGNATDGVLTVGALGGSSYIDGPVGQALKLEHDDATITTDKTEGAYVAIPITLSQEGSLVFWYHLGDLYNYQSVWDNSGNDGDFETWIYNDGRFRSRINGNVGQVTYQFPQPNSWYHIAYTWKRGDTAHLWINGVEVDTASTVREITEAGFDGAILGDTFYLGGGHPGNTFGNGAYDDFRLYDGVLDEAAIQAILAAGTPPAPTAADPAELLVEWDFEDDFLDSSGNGRDGTLVEGALGSHAFEPGPVGQALKLGHEAATLTTDKVDGAYVQLPLTLPDSGSLAFWCRPDPYYNYQSLWDNSGQADDWEMWIYADGVVRGRVDGGAAQTSAQLGRPLQWYHIAYTWQKGDQARIWVDGEEQDQTSAVRGLSDRQFDTAVLGDTFFLGGGNAGNTFGVAAFDDFRIYSGVLTGSEVQTLFEAGDPPVTEPPELLLHWKLEGDVTDSSGNGVDGTVVVGALGTADFEAARINQGLSLGHDADTLTTDATEGAYVSAPLVLGESGTIAMWYYVPEYYNYQSVWDNSVEGNDWEMWIYSDGRLRGRIDASSGDITVNLDSLGGVGAWYHIAYAWDRTVGFADLIINGELEGSAAVGTWVEPGAEFYIGGGHPGNTFGVGTFDEVRIYDKPLDAAAIRAVMREGEPPAIYWPMDGDLVNAGTLGAAGDGLLAAGASGMGIYTPSLYGQGLYLDNDRTASLDGAYVSVPYVLTESGTIAMRYYATPYYNYQSIFDNSVEANDWEMWIYNDGRMRGRIDGGSGELTYDLDNSSGPNHWYHVTYTWNRQAAIAQLFVDGEPVGTSAIGTWIEPGDTFYLGGGNDGNVYSDGIFDEVRIYDRALGDAEVAELASAESTCPEEGDTHVTSIEVTGPTGPFGQVPGTYTAEAVASDDSGDAVIYVFTADNGAGATMDVGPQLESTADFALAEGTWTITVDVDDNTFCADEADDATTSTVVEVGPACPEEGDTHVTALDVTGPTGPAGNTPGSYTAVATAGDDSGDAITYTFTVDNGVDPAQTFGPQPESSADFDLVEGDWTITVTVDDDECPDEALDASMSTVVEVGPEGVGPIVRGDCNGDGSVNISDPVRLLNWSFSGGVAEPPCLATCDVDGSGEVVGITDSIYLLNFLFTVAPGPAAPYPDCGMGLLESDFEIGCGQPTCEL